MRDLHQDPRVVMRGKQGSPVGRGPGRHWGVGSQRASSAMMWTSAFTLKAIGSHQRVLNGKAHDQISIFKDTHGAVWQADCTQREGRVDARLLVPERGSGREMATLSGLLAAFSEYSNHWSSLALSRRQQLFVNQLGLSVEKGISVCALSCFSRVQLFATHRL